MNNLVAQLFKMDRGVQYYKFGVGSEVKDKYWWWRNGGSWKYLCGWDCSEGWKDCDDVWGCRYLFPHGGCELKWNEEYLWFAATGVGVDYGCVILF